METKLIIVKAVLRTAESSSFVTHQVPSITVDIAGIPGDRHYGILRPATSRQKMYPRGTMVANRRQITVVSEEECVLIAESMGLPEIRPEWLGANLMLSGLRKVITSLSLGSRLLFPEGAGLICEGENLPCLGPGKQIADFYNQPELAAAFVKAAANSRGIICSIEREGTIQLGDICTIIPYKRGII
jgi:hypothetical protein